MTPQPSRPTGARVSLRAIAQAAGVSVMTVSYALRDNPEVSARQRRRIQRIAEKIGYRPDPLLTHLMQHLRSQRTLKTAPNLAVLTTLDAHFVRRLLAGAHARAERLGYHLDRVDVRPFMGHPGSLTRTLLARGVPGVLLAPVEDPASYASLLDWDQFAAVAMTYSVVEPRVHRVVTHHFDNALRALALLEQRGLRRIGLAMTTDMELRANHSYSAAYHRAANTGGIEPLPILFLNEADPAGVRAWFSRHRPTAVLVANSNHVREHLHAALGAEVCAEVPIRCLDYDPREGIAGIDQLFETIGGHAIDVLVAQLHRNERGLPASPTVTMVEGRWVETPLARLPRAR
ncbi:MAG TPA: LacI family DNA-binding transcriptional regulator [Candidatus Synoicihabitans sp.]|nr:LacI family DNA-binding transcriptional regulator [Candidatus Synoicihabitans sp.]